MLLKAFTKNLIKDREKTYLTVASTTSDSTLTVKDIGSFAVSDYIIVGEIGSEGSEIVRLHSSTAPSGTTITLTGALTKTHNIDDPVYKIDYNQVEFSHTTTSTGTKTVLSTTGITPDSEFTRYDDTTNTTGYWFIRFKNEGTTQYSEYSQPVPYTGYPPKSLFKMIKNVRRLLNLDDTDHTISDEDIIDELNEKQRDVYHERLWSFAEADFSFSGVQYQSNYELTSRISPGKVHTLAYNSQPLAKISQNKWEMLHWDTNTTGDPTHFSIFGNRIKVYPVVDTAAHTDALNGNITATATTIILDDVADFKAPGRVLIDSEVISFDYIDSTNEYLYGCRRGLEGTTAATHLDDAVVTARDFIGTGHKEPIDLEEMDSETDIPDPRVLEYGASMELALMKLNNQVLHDRLKIKYEQSIDRLRSKFGRKITGQFFAIRDKSEYPSDSQGMVNPQNYPQDLS